MLFDNSKYIYFFFSLLFKKIMNKRVEYPLPRNLEFTFDNAIY